MYSGGEFICLHGSQIGRVAERSRWAFEQCIRRYHDGKIKFNGEAHLLTFVYHQLGYVDNSANDLIKHIWTDRAISSNIDGSERNLTMWHLSAEKTGFRNTISITSSG